MAVQPEALLEWRPVVTFQGKMWVPKAKNVIIVGADKYVKIDPRDKGLISMITDMSLDETSKAMYSFAGTPSYMRVINDRNAAKRHALTETPQEQPRPTGLANFFRTASARLCGFTANLLL